MEELDKPHVIYTLPRSRSTAILEASKKENKLNEPFNPSLALRMDSSDTIKKMNDPDSATKFLAKHLENDEVFQQWFKRIDEKKSHKIFVIDRNLEEICWSYIIAVKFGWTKSTEKEELNNRNVTIGEIIFDNLENHIQKFLQYMPINAQILTWENLPEEYFDKSKITFSQKQNTKNRILKINNIQYCTDIIGSLVEKYHPMIKEKTFNMKRVSI